jgi:hypothetical protein
VAFFDNNTVGSLDIDDACGQAARRMGQSGTR